MVAGTPACGCGAGRIAVERPLALECFARDVPGTNTNANGRTGMSLAVQQGGSPHVCGLAGWSGQQGIELALSFGTAAGEEAWPPSESCG